MNIGEAAARSGVSAKMIRHYEDIGLVPAAGRTVAGYRVYGEAEVRTLRFVRHARDLGLPLDDIGDLLTLWRDRSRARTEVKRLALERVAALEAKAAALRAVDAALRDLAEACDCGAHRPTCPGCPPLDEDRRWCAMLPDQGSSSVAGERTGSTGCGGEPGKGTGGSSGRSGGGSATCRADGPPARRYCRCLA